MSSKYNVLIAGIGGVGGYFGGLLAKHYENNTEVKVNFLGRGKHLSEIQKNGLKVIHKMGDFVARPSISSDNAEDFGHVDCLILSIKSYDLESTLNQLAPCINGNTIILPLLNGVDSRERISQIYPTNLVLDGCVYIISQLKEPGVIENSGNIQDLHFGLDNYSNERLDELDTIFKNASINSNLSDQISKVIWEKFIFISSTATTTSYFDCTLKEIIENESRYEFFLELISEIIGLAKVKSIPIAENMVERALKIIKSQPATTTTSMHRDYINKKPATEVETLTGYIVREANKFQFETPTYRKAYEKLSRVSNSV
jgi:2-dehydropantoate 2-reductase